MTSYIFFFVFVSSVGENGLVKESARIKDAIINDIKVRPFLLDCSLSD